MNGNRDILNRISAPQTNGQDHPQRNCHSLRETTRGMWHHGEKRMTILGKNEGKSKSKHTSRKGGAKQNLKFRQKKWKSLCCFLIHVPLTLKYK